MREYLLVLGIAAAVTYLLCGVARTVALRVKAVAQVRDRDVHAVPIPYLGGAAMFLGVAAAMQVASHLPNMGRNPLIQHDFTAILIAGGVICAVGVLDDIVELNAIAKLAGQVLAAGLVVANGVKMLWIPLPNQIISLDDSASIAITVFVIVLCTNAVNYVDGLDGLAAGVVAIGAFAFFVYSYGLVAFQDLPRATTASLVTVVIVGVCLGFLPHNWFPARMFMGDSGSMLLGLLLATSTISLTGQIDSAPLQANARSLIPTYLPLVLPLAIMAVPIADFVLAFLRRTAAGKWFWVADKRHLHHRLLARGHSQRRAVWVMYGWTALISFGAVAFGVTESLWVLLVVAVLAAVFGFFTFGPGTRDRSLAEGLRRDREVEAAQHRRLG